MKFEKLQNEFIIDSDRVIFKFINTKNTCVWCTRNVLPKNAITSGETFVKRYHSINAHKQR